MKPGLYLLNGQRSMVKHSKNDAGPTLVAWVDAVEQRKPFSFEHRLKQKDGRTPNVLPVFVGLLKSKYLVKRRLSFR